MLRWKIAAVVVGLLGLFSLVGGLIGFFVAKSTISAVVGLATFATLLPCMQYLHKERSGAIYLSGVIALLLDARFLIAYAKTPKVMPHLIIIVLSSCALATLGLLLLTNKRTV